MPYITIDKRRVEYETHGIGEPVVLCQPTWWPLDPWKLGGLVQLSERYRVFLFNHRGIGESAATDTEYSIISMAEDTLALMDALELERAHLVAFANGSMVALQLAQLHPERVGRIVLSAPGHPVSTNPRTVSDTQRRHVLEHGYESYIRGHAMDEQLFSPKTREAHPERAHALADALWSHIGPPEEYFKHALARTSFDVLSGISKVTHPVLVLTGADDTVARGESNPVESSRLLTERLPHAHLELVPGVRHMLYWEAPEACWPRVLDFLQTARPSQPSP